MKANKIVLEMHMDTVHTVHCKMYSAQFQSIGKSCIYSHNEKNNETILISQNFIYLNCS